MAEPVTYSIELYTIGPDGRPHVEHCYRPTAHHANAAKARAEKWAVLASHVVVMATHARLLDPYGHVLWKRRLNLLG